MQVAHFTPRKEDLLPEREIPCTYPNCRSTFKNTGNLDMHLQRRHRNEPMKRQGTKGNECVFHCPQLSCAYHELHADRKFFKSLKYLRQHYHKVHVAKTNVCDRCGKAFVSRSQLMVHMERLCGVAYACKDCGWSYNTMEALLTHGKRKGHKVRDVTSVNVVSKKQSAPKRRQTIREEVVVKMENSEQDSQTEALPPIETLMKNKILTDSINCVNAATNTEPPTDLLELCNQETQTEEAVSIKNEDIHCFNSISTMTEMALAKNASTNTQTPINIYDIPCHIEIETQTDDDEMMSLLRQQITFNNSTSPMHSSFQTTQMLPHFMHTYTQTYDDLLPDSLLGYNDIQTQTNWSSFVDATGTATAQVMTTEEEAPNQYHNLVGMGAGNECTRCTYDDMLVSTETQTSFTQCLLESRTTTNAANAEDGNFANLYQTQHTQTCDMLLGALFGSQESDLIGGGGGGGSGGGCYQSTHTQT